MTLITDPDLLAQGSEVTINTSTKEITLNIAGDLSTDGVTLKCLYSFLKEEWKDDSALIKFPFPMTPITDEQFEFVNGWNFADDASRYLVRYGGWAVRAGNGNATEMWAGVVTLGTLSTNAQVYYLQEDVTSTPTTVDFELTDAVNQAVQIWSDPNADGNPSDGYDYTGFLKLFVREWEYSYASSTNTEIGADTLTYQVYRFPLTNAADPKIQEATEGTANTGAYLDIDVEWIDGTTFEDPATARTWVVDEVGKDGQGRWFICTVGGTLDSAGASDYTTNGGTGTFAAYSGERQITGVGYFAYNIIVDGNVDDADANALAETIYTRIQYLLDQNADMDTGAGDHWGNVTDSLMNFVGDNLITAAGVWIDDFNSADINRITFTDVGGTGRNYLYTAALTIYFGDNLKNDTDAKYWVFFTNDDAGDNNGYDYGTANAIIVNDADSTPMTGTVSAASSVQKTFAYDSNVQRGTGSDGEDAPITAVAIGLDTGQFVSATATIERVTTNSVSLIAALERNYDNP